MSALDPQHRETSKRELWVELASELAHEDWGVLDDERLALGARTAAVGGEVGLAKRMRRELRQRFPASPAALSVDAEDPAVSRAALKG